MENYIYLSKAETLHALILDYVLDCSETDQGIYKLKRRSSAINRTSMIGFQVEFSPKTFKGLTV